MSVGILLLASIAFYLFAGPKYIIFILSRHLVHIHWQERFRSYTTMKAELQRQESFLQRKLRRLLRKDLLREEKRILLLDFAINLGILCVIKYTDFICQEFLQFLEDSD